MMNIPEKYKHFINDWDAHIIDLKHIDVSLFHNKDNQDIINGLQLFYQNETLEKLSDLTMTREAAITLSAIIDRDGELLKNIYEQEGEIINMCTSIDNLRMNARIEGKIEEKTQLLLKLLQNKLGLISYQTQESIKICSSDNLDILVEAIFTIQDEQDIINILEKN